MDSLVSVFFFNDTATTEIYTLSLHDALPISERAGRQHSDHVPLVLDRPAEILAGLGRLCAELGGDRKSTRLNSSHGYISYAVFCLKKKKQRCVEHRDALRRHAQHVRPRIVRV